MLTCTFCNTEQPTDNFYKGRRQCKTCYCALQKKREKRTYKDFREYKLKYIKERRENDIIFNIRLRVRSRVNNAFNNKGYSKNGKTAELIGCTFEELKAHLESQFIEGMSWENRKEWHIDHIIPLSSAKTKEELIKLSHYTNLQPLFASDNLKKGARL